MYSGLSAGPGTGCTSDPNLPTVAQEAFHELHLRILPQIVGDGLESSSPACRLSSCRFQHHLYGTLDLFLVLVVASVHKLLVLNGIGLHIVNRKTEPSNQRFRKIDGRHHLFHSHLIKTTDSI